MANASGAKVPFIRPKDLSTDAAKVIPVLLHALAFTEEEEKLYYEGIMMLQPTTLFKTTQDINDSTSLLDSSGSDSVVGVEGHHPAQMKYSEDGILVAHRFVRNMKTSQDRS